jgi:hypothetical protein
VDHLARLEFYDEEREERSKEQICHLQEVAGPDLSGVVTRDRSTTSDRVAGACELLACISGRYVYTHEGPVSTIPPESFQRPRVGCSSPFLGSRQSFPRRSWACEKRPLASVSNTSERAPDAT